MNSRSLAFFALCIMASCLWASCSDSGTNGNNTIEFPASGVSYNTHVQRYFNIYCATSGCHDNQTMAGNPPLSLTTYFNTTENPGIVIPGDPDASLLVQKINAGGWEGTSLPHDLTVPIIINENQYLGIRTWIKEGAKNN